MRVILAGQGEERQRAAIADLWTIAGDRARSAAEIFGLVVQYSLQVVALLVWLVVGFVFWIPLLARAIAGFCVTALYANLIAADVPNQKLRHAAFFYTNGFRSIYRAIDGLQSSEPETTASLRVEGLFSQSLWTVLFWWVTLMTLGYLGIAFTSTLDSLVYPVVWTVEEASATWTWLVQIVDSLRLSSGL